MSVLFDMNSEKSFYYCLAVTLWKCQYYLMWIQEKVFTIEASLRYLNHVFDWKHISAENANLKESTALNHAFI